MTVFQIIALLLLGYLGFHSLRNVARGRGRLRVNIGWLCLWILCSVAIVRPDLTGVVARFLGIGRGADLIFYLGVLATLVGFFYVYLRFRRVERAVTLLTRRLAILDAQHPTRLPSQVPTEVATEVATEGSIEQAVEGSSRALQGP